MDDLPERNPPITNVLFEIWRLSRRTAAAVDASLYGEQTGSDFGLYSLLRNLGTTTATELSDLTGSALSTISQQLHRLEERGHLERTPHPEDGRSTLVALTEAGRDVHTKSSPGFGVLVQDLRDELGDDYTTVLYGLRRLDEALCALLDLDVEGLPLPRAETIPLPASSLTAAQVEEVRRFADWVTWRDERADRG